jgi:hypothetical protein
MKLTSVMQDASGVSTSPLEHIADGAEGRIPVAEMQIRGTVPARTQFARTADTVIFGTSVSNASASRQNERPPDFEELRCFLRGS